MGIPAMLYEKGVSPTDRTPGGVSPGRRLAFYFASMPNGHRDASRDSGLSPARMAQTLGTFVH